MSEILQSKSELGIVTGGSGFIGTHLLRHLVESGRHEQILSLDIAPPHERLDGVRYETVDLRDPIDPTFGVSGATIYHLAALRNFPGHEDQEYYDTNVVSTQRIIDFAETSRAKTIVFTSTMSIYGPGEDAKTEKSLLAPVNPYGASKRICELLNAGWLQRNPDCQLITCRPAVIFGYRDDGNFTRLAKALQKRYFVYVARKTTIKSNGYVGDLVRSFTFCLDRPEREILYNFAYPVDHTIEDIVEAFRNVGGFSAPFGTLPLGLLNLAAIPFEVLNAIGLKNPVHRDRIRKLCESTNIVPMWLTENGFRFETDIEAALTIWRKESPDGTFV